MFSGWPHSRDRSDGEPTWRAIAGARLRCARAGNGDPAPGTWPRDV